VSEAPPAALRSPKGGGSLDRACSHKFGRFITRETIVIFFPGGFLDQAGQRRERPPPWCLWPSGTAYGLPSLQTFGWDQVDFRTATLHVRRVKRGTPSTHPILGDELRALRRLQREQEPKSPFVFTSERGAPFATAGFARMVERAGSEAKLGSKARPHMLRHACGHALANRGHDTQALQAYLGRRNIQHTLRYTELSPTRFKNFWRE